MSPTRMPSPFARGLIALGVGFFLACFLLHSLRADPVAHGSVPTDERAIIGAEQFLRQGFSDLHWTQVTDGRGELGFRPHYYARHPSGGVILLALQRSLGMPLPWARWLPLAFVTLGLVAFAAGVRRVTNSAAIGLTAGLLLATYSPFYLLADAYQSLSYSLFQKCVGFWLVVELVHRPGGSRGRWYGLIALLAFLGVTFFSLESLPGLGLFCFLGPLFLLRGSSWNRFRTATFVAIICGVGMGLGSLWRLYEWAGIADGDLQDAINHFRKSILGRSVRPLPELKHGRGYVEEIWNRLQVYAPIHLGVIALGLGTCFGTALIRRARPQWPGTALCLAVLLAEVPYFFVMRQHVMLHVHTTFQVGMSVAILGASGIFVVRNLSSRPRIQSAALGILWMVFIISPAVFTLDTYGNLRSRETGLKSLVKKPVFSEITDIIPEEAVVVIHSKWAQWNLRRQCALAGRHFIYPGAGDDLTAAEVLAYTQKTKRPLFVLHDVRPDDPVYRLLFDGSRVVAMRKRVALFAVDGFDPDTLPPEVRPLRRKALHTIDVIRPRPEELTARGGTPRLIKRAGRHVTLKVAPVKLGGLTVAEFPLPLPAARIAAVRVTLRYPPARVKQQPELLFSASRSGSKAEPVSLILRPDDSQEELVLPLPAGENTTHLRLELRRSETQPAGSADRILVEQIALELR